MGEYTKGPEEIARSVVGAIQLAHGHVWNSAKRDDAVRIVATELALALDRADYWGKRWKAQAAYAERLLKALRQVEQHCPCGARPESPSTHPHVGGCPVGEALRNAPELQPATGAQP